jgi:Na+/melibiose symporter-like transporter
MPHVCTCRVAGSSIPLSIISAVGQTKDLEDGSSSHVVVTTLRLWVSLVVSLCLLVAYAFLGRFRLTEQAHEEVVRQIQARERGEDFVPTDPLQDASSEVRSSLAAGD